VNAPLVLLSVFDVHVKEVDLVSTWLPIDRQLFRNAGVFYKIVKYEVSFLIAKSILTIMRYLIL